jgi:hypothetical protein
MTGSAGNYLVRCKKNRRRKLAIKIAEPPVSLPLLLSLQTSTSGVKFSIESGNSKQPLVDLDSVFVGIKLHVENKLSSFLFHLHCQVGGCHSLCIYQYHHQPSTINPFFLSFPSSKRLNLKWVHILLPTQSL